MCRFASAIFIVVLMISDCTKYDPLNDDNVMQIKNVGLRQGVCVRRFQFSSGYKNNATVSPESLKQFINKVLVPNYLFIQHAYDLDINKDSIIQQTVQEYKIGLIAGNHPISHQTLNISKKELSEFYSKKAVKYNLDIVEANSFYSADSIYQSIQQNNGIERPPNNFSEDFPHFLHIKDVTYGEKLHPEIFPIIEYMTQGQLSVPIYTSPIWTIVKLTRKMINNKLPPLDNMKKDLLAQEQALIKYEQQQKFVDTLKMKFPATVSTEFYQPIVEAYTYHDNRGWIDRNKFADSDLNKIFLHMNDHDVTLSQYIAMFNKGKQFLKIRKIARQDIEHSTDDYISKYVLYLDAVEKGVEKDRLVMDQLVNKEHRLLLSEYLKREIADKITISDSDALRYYNSNKNKWTVEYAKAAATIKNDLKNKAMEKRKNELINKLQKKYLVRYNEPLLKKIAEQLSAAKQGDSTIEIQAYNFENE
jgi:hypothetical protein